MTLDKVLTVAVGRNGADGAAMKTLDWLQFRKHVKDVLAREGLVVASAIGKAVGSDGVNEGQNEDTAVVVCINPENVERARKSLASLLPQYGQSSAAFAFDGSHEPVFPTESGYRLAV